MHRLCRRDSKGAVSLYNCYYDERTEESKHWHVRLKTERPCGLGISRKEKSRKEILPEMTLSGHHPKVDIIQMITTTLGEYGGI